MHLQLFLAIQFDTTKTKKLNIKYAIFLSIRHRFLNGVEWKVYFPDHVCYWNSPKNSVYLLKLTICWNLCDFCPILDLCTNISIYPNYAFEYTFLLINALVRRAEAHQKTCSDDKTDCTNEKWTILKTLKLIFRIK